MTNITVTAGETFRLHQSLMPGDAVAVQAGGALVADRLSFLEPANIIVDGTNGLLEIRHMPEVAHVDFSRAQLVLQFADATLPPVILNTIGTSPLSNLHPEQILHGSSDNNTFLLGAAPYPPHTSSVPTNFIL